jgi:hypothetical protein
MVRAVSRSGRLCHTAASAIIAGSLDHTGRWEAGGAAR